MIAFLSRSVVLTVNNVLLFWQKKVNYYARDLLPDKRTFVSQCWFEDAVCRNPRTKYRKPSTQTVLLCSITQFKREIVLLESSIQTNTYARTTVHAFCPVHCDLNRSNMTAWPIETKNKFRKQTVLSRKSSSEYFQCLGNQAFTLKPRRGGQMITPSI